MNSEIYVIAEAGVNHNGELGKALQLVELAAFAGADAVKFQTFQSHKMAVATAQKAAYQKRSQADEESQVDMLRALELDYEEFFKLKEQCDELGIEFLSTAFDTNGLDFLVELGVRRIKIGSGEITNLPFLRHAATKNLPVILSTGMASLDEVQQSVSALSCAGLSLSDISLLHCVTSYPTPFDQVNLRAISAMRKVLGLPIGFSDHTEGIEASVAAVSMGATIIEKHFTLDKSLSGPDHAASLSPEELCHMVKAIRNVELAFGDGNKKPQPVEIPNMIVARRSIVASTKIKKGELLSCDNLEVKRPGNGISPMLWDRVLGTPAIRDFDMDELIEIEE